MTRARKHLVCIADTPYYHITSRCVRRAFLCGFDRETGKDYEHRRGWIETRIRVLSSLFCIDVCAYAVMSNHNHLVVRVNSDGSDHWSDDEVLERWTALYRGPLLVQRYLAGIDLSEAEQATLRSIITVYRARLASLSWFMKCLNEPIARKVNAEDQCTGHFWEARFHSQSLLSDKALLSAMVYVDLNPIRATMARTPELSDYTSIKARLCRENGQDVLKISIQQMIETGELNHLHGSLRRLMPFSGSDITLESCNQNKHALPMVEREYFLLVDETARIVQQGKRGHMDPQVSPILKRLGLNEDEEWIATLDHFRRRYRKGGPWIKKTA